MAVPFSSKLGSVEGFIYLVVCLLFVYYFIFVSTIALTLVYNGFSAGFCINKEKVICYQI